MTARILWQNAAPPLEVEGVPTPAKMEVSSFLPTFERIMGAEEMV